MTNMQTKEAKAFFANIEPEKITFTKQHCNHCKNIVTKEATLIKFRDWIKKNKLGYMQTVEIENIIHELI